MRLLTIVTIAAMFSTATACGKPESDKSSREQAAPPAPPAAPAPTPAAAAPAKAVQHVEIEIESVANTMAFDKTTLTVPTGAEVHLVFKNHATMTTLPHNWALVKPGTEARVAAAGLKIGDQAGYFDVTNKDALAHTPMAKPGETTEVTFTAPEPGAYPYICTVPGHYMLMKGVLTVTP